MTGGFPSQKASNVVFPCHDFICVEVWDRASHWPLGDFKEIFRKVIFQLILVVDGWSISCKMVLKWMPMDLTDSKSTLVQVMAWCRQATSHYMSQCWPRSLSPYGVIRPQWVKNPVIPTMPASYPCIMVWPSDTRVRVMTLTLALTFSSVLTFHIEEILHHNRCHWYSNPIHATYLNYDD